MLLTDEIINDLDELYHPGMRAIELVEMTAHPIWNVHAYLSRRTMMDEVREMHRSGITQTEIADMMGVHKSTISRFISAPCGKLRYRAKREADQDKQT